MPETAHLPVVIILLAAAVVAVALFRRLHVSPVLGYLAAGAAIGPGGIKHYLQHQRHPFHRRAGSGFPPLHHRA